MTETLGRDTLDTTVTGVDDATKCPCIGSIFIAGVVGNEHLIELWRRAGVKDSKLLSRKRRDELDRMIRHTALTWSVRHIPPAEIDDKALNLNAWEMVAFLRLLRSLDSKQPINRVIVDNWEVNCDVFFKRIDALTGNECRQLLRDKRVSIPKRLHRRLAIIPEHRADTNHTIVVGAASILARAASDRQYDRYRKLYGDFGSGSPGDPRTRTYVWKHRHAPTPIIRQSWNTFKTLCELRRIEDDYWYHKKTG